MEVEEEEEESYTEGGTEPLLEEECATWNSCYTGCSSAKVTHRSSSLDGGGDDKMMMMSTKKKTE